MKNQNDIKLIITMVVILFLLSGCQSAQNQPTEVTPLITTSAPPTTTPYPPTSTPEPPTVTPTQTIILASDQPIKIGDFSIVINWVIFGDNGFNPWGLSSNTGLDVSVSEESGKIDELVALGIWFTDGAGVKFESYLTETGTNYLGEQTLDYRIYIPEPAAGYLMHFPTGEVIDLSAIAK